MVVLILAALIGSLIGFAVFQESGFAAGLLGMAGGGALSIAAAAGYLAFKVTRVRTGSSSETFPDTVADNSRT
jgi:hypothetical protein